MRKTLMSCRQMHVSRKDIGRREFFSLDTAFNIHEKDFYLKKKKKTYLFEKSEKKKVFFQAFALHVSFLPKYAVSLQNLGLSI